MIEIQSDMTQRALELLNLPEDRSCLLLDIGCGSGLCGEELSEHGHEWIGLDISGDMLNVAREREVDGDVCLADAGQGVVFRPGTFDGAVSISCIQWLCNADRAGHNPRKRLARVRLDTHGYRSTDPSSSSSSQRSTRRWPVALVPCSSFTPRTLSRWR